MRRRAAVDPEEGGRRDSLHTNIHQHGNVSTAPARRRPVDPPDAPIEKEPTISLNSRQLSLLKQRQERGVVESSLSSSKPFVTRSNQAQRLNSTTTDNSSIVSSEQTADKNMLRHLMHDRRVSTEAPRHTAAAAAATQTPTRTPNPVSRSDYSGKKNNTTSKSNSSHSTGEPNRAFLRNLLQKASTQDSDSNRVDQKALLRKVLAKTKAKKKARGLGNQNKAASPKRKTAVAATHTKKPVPGSRAAAMQNHSMASSLRDRMRRVKQTTTSTTTNAVVAKERAVAAPTPAPAVAAKPVPKPPADWRKQEHSMPVSSPSSDKIIGLAVDKNDESQEIQGYKDFLETLQTEVSGQHSQLWSSFSAVMQGREVPPIENPVPVSKKRYRFDAETKNKLTAMNLHLKKHSPVDTVPETQLVNDKKLAKMQKSSNKANSSVTTTSADSVSTVSIGKATSHDSSDAILKMRSSSSTNSWTKKAAARQKDAILNSRSSADESLDQHRAMPALTDMMSGSMDTQDKSRANGVRMPSPGGRDFETASNPGLEVTLGQFESKYTTPSPTASSLILSPTGSQSSVPSWSGIRLRRVGSASGSPADDASSVATSSSAPVPWAKVALRRVDGPKDLMEEPTETASDASSDLAQVRLAGLAVEAKTLMLPPANRPVFRRESNVPAALDTTIEQTQDKDDNKRVRDKIDEAVVFRLERMANMKESEEARVMVGKKALMMVQSEAGESQARVLWRLPREGVQSLTLDMASRQVKLVMVEKGQVKTLSFSSSDDCLKFANAFYEMPTAGPRGGVPSTIDAKDVDTVASSVRVMSMVDDESTGSASHLEQLNDEEQTVLEHYRRLRKLKPAEDALEESLSLPSGKQQESGSSLSAAENEVANKYRRMLKLNIPLDAVKHKMMRDDVDSKVSDTVVLEATASPPTFVGADELPPSPLSTMSSSVALSGTDMEVAETYKKMLKLKIPQDAVRHKMMKDGVDPNIIALVIGDDSFGAAESSPESVLTVEEEKIASSYRKMLKMCIPVQAVRHKMMKDEIHEKIVLAVLGPDKDSEPSKSGAAVEAGTDIASVVSKASSVRSKTKSSLTTDEESVASQYRKLLKLQIPKGQVLERMKKEGIEEKIIAAVVGDKLQQSASTASSKSDTKTGSKLVSLHWTPLSGKELDNSVWNTTKNRNGMSAQPEGSDISKLVELFQKKTNVKASKETKCDDSVASTAKAKLLDLTRSNNIAISLKAFKEFSNNELREIIAFLDPRRKLRGERVEFLRDLLPTATEVKIIQAYTGSADRLVPAEKWFRQIAGIKRIESKIDVMRTLEMFVAEAEASTENFRILTRVCNQAMHSAKLQDLLEMVLRVGNIMNEGTRTGGASGFKFDSLLRLTQTKSSDGKTTVLDFLVITFVTKGQRDTLNLSADFPDCQTASRMLVTDLVSEVKNLQTSLKQCEDELTALQEELSGRKAVSRPVVGKLGASSAGGSSLVGARAELMASLLCGAVDTTTTDQPTASTPPKVERFTKRDQFLAAIKEGSSNGAATDGEEPKENTEATNASSQADKNASADQALKENSRQGGIDRLEDFLRVSSSIFTELDSNRNDALAACRDLSKYCGEAGGVGATSTLLGILSQFASNIDSALKKYDDQQEAESRRQRKKGDPVTKHEAAKDKSGAVTPIEPTGQSKSLVLLVNEMLKDSNDRTIEDFKKGRVYPQASDRLKAIYDKEQTGVGSGSPGKARKNLDIVSAIREREGKLVKEEAHEARFEFSRVMQRLSTLEADASEAREPATSREDVLEPSTPITTHIEKIVLDVRGSQQRLVIGSPERPRIKVANAVEQFETTKKSSHQSDDRPLSTEKESPLPSTRALEETTSSSDPVNVSAVNVPGAAVQLTDPVVIDLVTKTSLEKGPMPESATQAPINVESLETDDSVVEAKSVTPVAIDLAAKTLPQRLMPLTPESLGQSLPAETQSANSDATENRLVVSTDEGADQANFSPTNDSAVPTKQIEEPVVIDLVATDPTVICTDEGGDQENSSLTPTKPVEPVAIDLAAKTPPRKLPTPESTERKSLLDMAKEKRASRSSLGVYSQPESSVDLPQSTAVEATALQPETGQSQSVGSASAGSTAQSVEIVPKSKERKSLSEMAKEKRASRSSPGGNVPETNPVDEAPLPLGKSDADPIVIPDDARGTIVEEALLGNVYGRRESDASTSESAVSRLARLKREDKVSIIPTNAMSPPRPDKTFDDVKGESTMARLARLKRESRTKESPSRAPSPSLAETSPLKVPKAPALSTTESSTAATCAETTKAVVATEPSKPVESAMVRMARGKREKRSSFDSELKFQDPQKQKSESSN